MKTDSLKTDSLKTDSLKTEFEIDDDPENEDISV